MPSVILLNVIQPKDILLCEILLKIIWLNGAAPPYRVESYLIQSAYVCKKGVGHNLRNQGDGAKKTPIL
jgi:hypothetical protein